MNKHQWRYDISQCDVTDHSKLLEFRRMSEEWIRCLSDDEENSVSAQIREMMWYDAAWRSLNHTRFLAKDRTDVGTAPLLAPLLDRGYLTGQVISISRLLENGSSRGPYKQVNSLKRMLDEIEANKHLFTRQNFICRDGLPYEWEPIMHEEFSRAPRENGVITVGWVDFSGPKSWAQSQLLHVLFDRLSGASSCNRSREDIISDQYLKSLRDMISAPIFSTIIEMRHKSIAHAATDFSRASSANLKGGLSLDEIEEAQRLLVQLYKKLASEVINLYSPGNVIPTPQQNVFSGMELPIIRQSDIPELEKFWAELCSSRDSWLE